MMSALRDLDPGVIDFRPIFESAPTPFLLLRANQPDFTIVAVNDAYLRATGREREALVGRRLFDAFPGNPHDANDSGESDLRASLERVLRDRVPDGMGVQRYDIPSRE